MAFPVLTNFPTFSDTLVIMPELMLTLFACFALVIDVLLPRERRGLVAQFCLIGIGFSAVSLWMLYGELRPFSAQTAFYGTVVVDGFAVVFKSIFLLAALLSIILSMRYLDTEGMQRGEYYALILFATVGMMFMASGMDVIVLYVGLELMALSVYVLVGFLKQLNPITSDDTTLNELQKHVNRSTEAGLKYFLMGAFSSGVLLYGLSLLFGVTGTTYLPDMGEALFQYLTPNARTGNPQMLILLGIILTGAGLLFKIAAVPFHMWAPDAYQGAPTSITAFMSVGPKAASYALLARIFLVGFEPFRTINQLPGWAILLGVIAGLTMTVGNIGALTQSNVKRLLAYSSISHAGYILLGIVAGNEFGYTGVVIYLLVYVLMNLGAFGVLLVLRRQDLAGEKLDDFNGLFHKAPGLAAMMLIFLLSLAGIPMTGGFIGKFYLFGSLLQSNIKWMNILAVIAVLNTVVSLYYYARFIRAMFLNPASEQVQVQLTPTLRWTLTTAAVLVIVIGVYPSPFIRFSKIAAQTMYVRYERPSKEPLWKPKFLQF